jgi:uncharacterized damage-inducible protein DinB
MTEKEMFLASFEREFATTLKVLKAYPSDKGDLKPHERSMSARELAWIFVVEQQVIVDGALAGAIDFSKMTPAPATMHDVIAAYERIQPATVSKVKQASEAALNKTVKFPVAPKTMGDLRVMDVLWGMMHDQIHHRGQLSVYLRMAGGKVPSIYGPSADEPWM